ncbi:MAG TPA: SLC13 family permease [Mycobacteriales bacterium]|nr:SLC13 family permease [Mycobacteriales bacterium]
MLSSTPAEALSVAALLVTLVAASRRPRGLSEAVVAVPAAGVVILAGAISAGHIGAELRRIGPVIGFLVAVLVLARLCDEDGLFTAAGALLAARTHGRSRSLLAGVFVLASVTTAVLSLDTTVVLLTPVVLVTAGRVRISPRPPMYACAHLANTGSLLLPVSNLTNLLVYSASGLSFTRFALLMTLPWLAAIGVEFLVFRRFFATDLGAAPVADAHIGTVPVPRFCLAVVLLTLGGFVLTSAVGVNPAWAAGVGAAVLAVRALARRQATVADIAGAASIPFCLFVLALGLIVRAVSDDGLGRAVRHLVPGGTGLAALLAIAGLGAALANIVNNLPAVLLLAPVAALAGPGPVLALLVGVNIGPNLTYIGSLATLLWRRVLADHGESVSASTFTRLGIRTVPPALVASVLALWGGLRVIGS